MKKLRYFSLLIIFSFLVSLIYFPIPEVKASNSWDNFIDFVRTNLGFVSVNNGTLSGMSRDDFYDSLYNTPLVWTDNGQDFSFTPSNEFTRAEWTQVCKVGTSDDSRFNNFNIQDCLIKSDYIKDNGSGYDLSSFPSISASNSISPIDGIEVFTNFSNYNGNFDSLLYPSSVQNCFNSFKESFLNINNRLTIISGNNNTNYMIYCFLSPTSTIDFFGLYYSSNNLYVYAHNINSNNWTSVNRFSSISAPPSTSSGVKNSVNLGSIVPSYFSSNESFNSFDSTFYSTQNAYGALLFNVNYWSNIPVVVGSSSSVIQNYYVWLKGAPSGGIYTTANATDTIYNYEYVNNNNWETAYNNYITDVSNYYSTTENITNENLTQYIDNSTTITNITNNYITNSGGGSGEDDVITNSWLERIYEKILEIISILKGESVSESGDTYYTDNSVKNDILRYPIENMFPNIDESEFIDEDDLIDNDGLSWDLIASKIGSVISEVVPFVYIFQLRSIALALSAPPEEPYFEIPFKIDRLNIDEYIIIDLTDNAWDTVHTVWIALFMIMFIGFLFYLTKEILMLLSNMFG